MLNRTKRIKQRFTEQMCQNCTEEKLLLRQNELANKVPVSIATVYAYKQAASTKIHKCERFLSHIRRCFCHFLVQGRETLSS